MLRNLNSEAWRNSPFGKISTAGISARLQQRPQQLKIRYKTYPLFDSQSLFTSHVYNDARTADLVNYAASDLCMPSTFLIEYR